MLERDAVRPQHAQPSLTGAQADKEFKAQPVKETSETKFAAINAQPGPVLPKEMPPQEGTREERQARMEALNK